MAGGTNGQATKATGSEDSAAERRQAITDFTGGISNVPDITSIGDNELQVIMNMEIDPYGSLVSRPPFVTEHAERTASAQMTFCGWYYPPSGARLMVFSDSGGTFTYDVDTHVYTTITTFVASGCAQYQGLLYICGHAGAGGHWDGTTYTSQSTGTKPMPAGDQIVLYNDRLWIAGYGSADERTKVYLSDITSTAGTSINDWPVTNFFYVSRGDGQWITKLYASPYDLQIFRNKSAYYFSYSSDPKLGTLTRFPGEIGCDSKWSLAVYQNYVYVVCAGGLYQIVSYQFYQRNDPARFRFEVSSTPGTRTMDTAVSVVGTRMLIWFSGTLYCYNLNSGAFSQWSSDLYPAALFPAMQPEGSHTPIVAYGVSGTSTVKSIIRFTDAANALDSEQISCMIRTKAFDFGAADRTKVMFWWLADTLMSGVGTGSAIPITLTGDSPTWDDLDAIPGGWDQLATATWDNPTVKTPGAVHSDDSPSASPRRVALKFVKKMRFRRIYYEVALETDGTTATGPAQIFGLVAYVEVRQKVTREVA